MKALLLLLLSCGIALGQSPLLTGSGIDWTKAPSGVPGPSSVTNLAYWWVASDLTLNTKVTNWVDRIQGAVWTNGDTATQPTNSTSGVCFDTTTELTNSVLDLSGAPWNGGATWCAVIQPISVTPGVVSGVWIKDTRDFGIGFLSSGNAINVNSFGVMFKGLTVKQDWMFPIAGGGSSAYFTNNVQAHDGTGGNLFNNKTYRLASAVSGGTKGAFFIQEFLIYTNLLATQSVNRATLHTYFTNTYNFAP